MAGEDLWTSYWRRDAVSSSIHFFPAAVRSAIEDRWRRRFAALGNGARVLDVAAGSGALAALAASCAGPARSLVMTGTDLAAASAAAIPESAHFRYRFRSGVDSAGLPFGNGDFDLVVSQFGIEYGDFHAALPEAARVTSDGLTLLVHAAEGTVVRQNGAIAAQITWLLGDLELPARLRAWLRAPGRETGERLAAVARAMAERGRTLENPDFLASLTRDVGHFLESRAGRPAAEGIARVDALEAALRNHAERMGALAAAACTGDTLDAAAEALEAAGFARTRCEAQRSPDGRHLVGYWLEARRRP